MVVLQHDGLRVGLVVETLHGERKTVIKPLGKAFRDVPLVSGCAILGSGRVALILDLPEMVLSGIENSRSTGNLDNSIQEENP